MIIDLHAHVIPGHIPEVADPDVGDAAGIDGWPRIERSDRGGRVLAAGALRLDARDAFFDPEPRLEAMDANGVDAEVVSPLPPLLNYALGPKRGRDLCRHVNESIAGLCAGDPSRFHGLGTVPLQDPDLAAEELSKIGSIGLRGIEIGSNVNGASLGDERFLGFFQEAERLRVPVFVHALNPTFTDRLPRSAIASFGFATDIALAAASIVMGGTAERCPELRLAFSHGAGGFPLMLTRAQWFWAGTWNEEPRPEGHVPLVPGQPAGSPSEYARRFYYDALVFDRRALSYLIDMLGPSRLLLGTDFPAMPREQPADRTLRSMGLDPGVLEDITWNNALRFLGIEAPAPAGRSPLR